MQWKQRWAQICKWVAPQTNYSSPAGIPTLEEREQQRRGSLLAAVLVAGLPFNLLLLIGSLPLCFHAGYLSALTIKALFEARSLFLNRRGRVDAACVAYLAGTVLGCAGGLFGGSESLPALSLCLYAYYRLGIILSGFLLGRRAPFALAFLGVALIGTHLLINPLSVSLSPGLTSVPVGVTIAIQSIMLFLIALISALGAGSMADAMARGDRAEEIELLYYEAEYERQLAEHLQTLAARLTGELDRGALLRQVAEDVRDLGYAGCALLLAEREADGKRSLVSTLNTFEPAGWKGELYYRDDLPMVRELLHGEPQRICEPTTHPVYDACAQQRLQALGITDQLGLPIRYHGKTLGCLVVWASEAAWGRRVAERPETETNPHLLSTLPRDPFCPAAVRFLASLADHAALALGNTLRHQEIRDAHERLGAENEAMVAQAEELSTMNARLLSVQAELEAQYRALEVANAQLAARATSDGMTGLANHRAFQEELARQVARSERAKGPLSLLLLDVDYFKKYNDTFGHPAGDEVLRTVARLLAETVREGDFPARYGGEEFAVILPDTEAETAAHVAERIRAAVESHSFAHRQVTVSIGVADYSPGEAADLVIQRADVALYEAKSAGRNCAVTLAVEVVEMQESSPELQAWLDDPRQAAGAREENDALAFREPGDTVPRMITSDAEEAPFSEAEPEEAIAVWSPYGSLEGLLQESAGPILMELLAALDRRGAEARGHAERVARYVLRLSVALAELYDEQRDARPLLPRLTPSDLIHFAFGALLHDIGQVGVPDAVLNKAGKLTDDEWRQIRRHPLAGAELISPYPLLARALPVVRYHHERWDGEGYPQGLAGAAVPLGARLFAVCDTLDSLTTARPYRKQMEHAAAREEIQKGAGTQFDPDVVEAFLRVTEQEWQQISHSRLAPAPPMQAEPFPRAA